MDTDLVMPDDSAIIPSPGYYAKRIENEVALMALEVERHASTHVMGEMYNPYAPRFFRYQWAVDAYLKLAHLSASYYGITAPLPTLPEHPGLDSSVIMDTQQEYDDEEYGH